MPILVNFWHFATLAFSLDLLKKLIISFCEVDSMDGPNDSMLKVDEPLQPKYELQPSEMQWLFSRISVVDRDRVLAESKKCAWYMFLTRGG